MHESTIARATGLIMERLSVVAMPTVSLGEFRQLAENAARDIITVLAGQTITVIPPTTAQLALQEIPPEFQHVIDGRDGTHTVAAGERQGVINGIEVSARIAAEFLPGMTPEAIDAAYTAFLTDDPPAEPWSSPRE